jgi:hypothetical protein
MPRLYDITWEKPPPLVERYLRRVVDERVDGRGNGERALDPAEAEREVDFLLKEGVEAIAVCLLNSFANPAHELAIKEIIERKAPGLPYSISYEVLPEIKEYERTSTTVINAYVMPIVATYLRALRKGLDAADIAAPLLLMQSNGGLTTDRTAAEKPMNIIESGPAGGVVGAGTVPSSPAAMARPACLASCMAPAMARSFCGPMSSGRPAKPRVCTRANRLTTISRRTPANSGWPRRKTTFSKNCTVLSARCSPATLGFCSTAQTVLPGTGRSGRTISSR